MLNRNARKALETILTLKEEIGNHINVLASNMDLAEQASVIKAAEEILSSVPKIDALICNAAIAQVPKQTLIREWQNLKYFQHDFL